MNDIKVIDTLKEMEKEEARRERNDGLPFNPLALFAEAVAMTRNEPGLSIEAISLCFRHQFDQAELDLLIGELMKGSL